MSSPEAIFDILIRRGLLAAAPAPVRLTGGNADRSAARSSWQATLADGTAVKLTVGADLTPTNERHRAAYAAAPDFVPAPVFFECLPEGDVFAERFVPTSGSAETPANLFTSVCARLDATRRPSTAAARRNEWRRWTTELLGLDVFTATERTLLADVILPSLFRGLATGPATTRWTNGDLRSGNVRIDPEGRPWLIDHEHGARTHFFGEDDVRWFAFSPEVRGPAAPSPTPTALDPAWNLYFWLRQFALEVVGNTPAYRARMMPDRKAVIRRLAEGICGRPLDGWSTEALRVDFAIEDLRWLQHEEMTVFVSGWCHLPGNLSLESLHLVAPDGAVASLERVHRPDVQQHFGATSDAQVAGFTGRLATGDFTGRFLLGARRTDGAWLPLAHVNPADVAARGPSTGHYSGWAQRFDAQPALPTAETSAPRFSLLLPVYNTPPAFLRACLDSVFAQSRRNWELIVVDDGSPDLAVGELLRALPADPRVRLTRRAQNGGIARATNDALALAQGDFIVLLDHDDLLRPHALHRLAQAIGQEPAADVWYSDEDKISEDGRRLFPFFKPAYSPEFLRSVMYPGHVLCVRRSLATSVGGFDPAFDGVQDYEFFLRLSEHTTRIRHLPEILYHWRRSPGSSALHGNVKGDMDARQLAAVSAHLARRGDPRVAESLGGHRVRLRAGPAGTRPSCFVHTVGASHDPLVLLRRLAAERTEDVLILLGVAHREGSEGWEAELAAVAALDDSGCIAPVLISSEHRILESGCTLASERLVPMMVNFDPDDDGYNGAGRCNREVVAVSPLCFAVRRKVVLDSRFAPAPDWGGFLAALQQVGLHHRVCTAARVKLPLSASGHAHPWRMPPGVVDPYFNPAFRREPADYTFVAPLPKPVERVAFAHHLDSPLPEVIADGCLELRGWCTGAEAAPVAIIAEVAGIQWAVTAASPRPDVAKALRLDRDACGFSINLRIPAGRHTLVLRAQDIDAHSHELLRRTIVVPRSAAWRRAFRTSPERLLACQLAATPQHAPRPLHSASGARRKATPSGGPRFSVVTPSFQQAPFLRETITRVLQQDVPGDYVIQDGGSTDGSADIIAAIAREPRGPGAMRIAAWECAPDFGQTDALQRGFAKTNGAPDDVMAWINADDFYLPGAFAVVADYLARHPEVDVVYGHRLLVDKTSSEIGRWHLPPHDPAVLERYDFVPQETLFWRRRLWERVGGVNPDFQFAMDWDLLLRFQAAGATIVRLPCFLACFRLHQSQKTSAQLGSVGQEELDTLRFRTFGRKLSAAELIADPNLYAYLKRSARLDLLAAAGWRGRTG